jgi:hypothetical protein
MAIDKSRTSPLMKAIIIFIALTFVLGIGFTGLASSCTPGTTGTTTNPTGTSASTTQTIDAIGLQYTPVIQATEASITADPKNYALLVQQADTYYKWGAQVRQSVQTTDTSRDVQIWKSAATYYARAIAVKSGDVQVMGDYAVALFYSSDVSGAIVEGEKVRTIDAKFAPNLFNLGIFYQTAGDTAKAKAAYEAYLAVEPAGQSAQAAKDNIAALK